MEIISLVLGLQSGLGSDDISRHRHRLNCDSIREGLQGSGEAGDPERSIQSLSGGSTFRGGVKTFITLCCMVF